MYSSSRSLPLRLPFSPPCLLLLLLLVMCFGTVFLWGVYPDKDTPSLTSALDRLEQRLAHWNTTTTTTTLPVTLERPEEGSFQAVKTLLVRLHRAISRAQEQEIVRPSHLRDVHGVQVWGHVAQHPGQLHFYWRLAVHPLVKTVCEVGFNAGHSAVLWLASNPRVHVYSFDIGERYYFRVGVSFVNGTFPGRMDILVGNSRSTVPEFAATHPDMRCDLVHIDGDHEGDAATHDVFNFRPLAHPDTLLVVDDVGTFDGPKRAWEKATTTGVVRELECHATSNKRWCLGRYKETNN